MAAYECGSTDFPSPPYPDSILCPETEVSAESKATNAAKAVVTIWSIMSKVRVEAFCWGAGTALGIQYFSQLFVYYFRQLFCLHLFDICFSGELPPYFMARAHRLSGYDSDDEEDEFEELQEKKANNDLVRQLYSITLDRFSPLLF